MSAASRADRPHWALWQPQNLRLLAFPLEPPVFKEQKWWEEIAGSLPDDFSSTKKKQERQDQGSFGSDLFLVATDVLKIQLSLEPKTEMQDIPEGLPSLGDFLEKLNLFKEMMIGWLAESCPPVTRLSFVSELLQPVSSHESGYEKLGKYLPSIKLDPKSSDFLYRINRKRDSDVCPSITINRVTNWHVKKYGMILQPIGGGIPFEHPIKPTSYYCYLSLDINTTHENKEGLPRDRLCDLFQELVSLGTEIADRGDVP